MKQVAVRVRVGHGLKGGDWIKGTLIEILGSGLKCVGWICHDFSVESWPNSTCFGLVIGVTPDEIVVAEYTDILVATWKWPLLQAEVESRCLRSVFAHYRPVEGKSWDRLDELPKYSRGKTHYQPAVRGGKTECYLRDSGGEVVGRGMARCMAIDPFAYIVGRALSLDRALASVVGESRFDLLHQALIINTGYVDSRGQPCPAIESRL